MLKRASKRLKQLRYTRARRAEQRYSAQLQSVARTIGSLIDGMAPGGVLKDNGLLQDTMSKYAQLLRPWARSAVGAMLTDVDRRDYNMWGELSNTIGSELKHELRYAPTGRTLREALARNVDLITSLPTDAAARVHKLTVEALVTGRRAEDIAKEIMRSGEVTKSRAKLIARTEVGRTAEELKKTRAQHVGSPGYIWRTVGDADVRESHAEMEGVFVAWGANGGQGAQLSDGTVCHAGTIYNCRCYAEPVLPDWSDE